jgi:hypothetical protein
MARRAQGVLDLTDPQVAEVAVHIARSARERSLRSLSEPDAQLRAGRP